MKRTRCDTCKRTFKSLGAYLWHLELKICTTFTESTPGEAAARVKAMTSPNPAVRAEAAAIAKRDADRKATK